MSNSTHLSPEELHQLLTEARAAFDLSREYVHYKDPASRYRVKGFAIIEASDSVGVLYESQLLALRGITFMRPIESFLEVVNVAGRKVSRFSVTAVE
jgi:hypothetical protein